MIGLSRAEVVEAIARTNVGRTAAANTKSSYTQIIAATAIKYDALTLDIAQNSGDGGADSFLVDLAIGAGGSEQVIVPNVLVDSTRAIGFGRAGLTVPVLIPSGTRIAARLQETAGAGTRTVNVALVGRNGGANRPRALGGDAIAYGADTTNTTGTLIDQGASANAYGSWIQMTASTSRDHRYIGAIFGNSKTAGNPTNNPFTMDVQLAVGAGGSEQIIGYTQFTIQNWTLVVPNLEVWAEIPAGSRLAMRSKCTGAGSNDRLLTAILYGV